LVLSVGIEMISSGALSMLKSVYPKSVIWKMIDEFVSESHLPVPHLQIVGSAGARFILKESPRKCLVIFLPG
jgi:hypothetical protein